MTLNEAREFLNERINPNMVETVLNSTDEETTFYCDPTMFKSKIIPDLDNYLVKKIYDKMEEGKVCMISSMGTNFVPFAQKYIPGDPPPEPTEPSWKIYIKVDDMIVEYDANDLRPMPIKSQVEFSPVS